MSGGLKIFHSNVSKYRSKKASFFASLFAALAVALESHSTIAQSPMPTAGPSPRELFARTFERLQSYPIPPYAIYSTRWRVLAYSVGQPPEYDVFWRYAIRTSDGLENAASPQSEEWLPPATITNEYLGIFATILRAPAPIVSASPDTASELKTIAVVAATREDYRIDLVSTENIDGNLTDHLRLTPLRSLPKYNLRDLWIDAQTFDLRRARFLIVRHPEKANWNGSAMTVDFGPALQYWIVMRENWFAGGPYGSHLFDVATLRVAFPPTLPGWIFDQSAYDRRQKAGASDLLDKILTNAKPPTNAQICNR